MHVLPFEYRRVRDVAEAAALLRERGPGARLLAGGQSLLPLVNLGLAQPELLIDIGHIEEMRGVESRGSQLIIGACATYSEVLAQTNNGQPLLAEAIRNVGSLRVRNIGTVGGAVAHADPSAEVPLALCVLEAEYEVAGLAETRRVRAADFAQGYYTTVLSQDEVLVRIHVPKHSTDIGWGFHEYSRRSGDFAIVAAAAIARCADGTIQQARVGLAGVGDVPVRCRSLEAAAVGISPQDLDGLAGEIVHDISPEDDAFVSAAYRSHLARVLAVRALRDACQRSIEARS